MILANYLKKHSFRAKLIEVLPSKALGIVIVIPVHNEISVLPSLQSILNCQKPNKSVEVILVFNASETADYKIVEINQKARKEAEDWFCTLKNPLFQLYTLEENSLPRKHAGVGFARKIGMDEAVRRFEKIESSKGIIVCFDADSQCQANYLVEIEKHFNFYPDTSACSIHFEHPLDGEDFNSIIYKGIANYELHLRYYKNGLEYAGLPFAYHTIGSSMAVNVLHYCRQGGMNRRKAGEDFYFLQKFIDLGNFSELNSTTVIPSPRQSNRVPFGTGRAIEEMLKGEREIEKSYAFESFEVLKECFSKVDSWYTEESHFNEKLVAFFGEEKLLQNIEEIRTQSSSLVTFRKRFFLWFNAFQTLKFLHFLRDKYYPIEPLTKSVPILFKRLKLPFSDSSVNGMLSILREKDKT